LIRDVDKRLGSGATGSENVKKHPFFKSIDWEKLERKEMEPPFKPKVKNVSDISQIDTAFTTEKPQDSLVEDSLSETVKKENTFDGFTFAAPSVLDEMK